METQPQLLLLQKTMVLVEGVGPPPRSRSQHLDPGAAADRRWMRENRGPEAQLRQRLETVAEMIERLPRLVESLDALVGDVARDGVVLHAELIASHAAEQAKRAYLAVIPLWLAAAALTAIAVALFLRR